MKSPKQVSTPPIQIFKRGVGIALKKMGVCAGAWSWIDRRERVAARLGIPRRVRPRVP